MSRFQQWRHKWADRLARSSRVFLLGVIVACGVEVIGDWNSTLSEITQLRLHVHRKGINYVRILDKPSQEPLRAHDDAALALLTKGVFDDDDAVCVRYFDKDANVVYGHVRPDYEPTFAPHRELYDHLMTRDVTGMLKDPAAYQARVKNSRYRDFAQAWTDTIARVTALVSKPVPPPHHDAVLYQDRLRDENHRRNEHMTWAIGIMEDASSHEQLGAVLVAFDMSRTNSVVRSKYIKGFGVVAFFVALIVVQNIIARRDKLRLLDLQARYASAKQALRDAMPDAALEASGLRVAGALDQAKGPVDGMVWSVARSRAQGQDRVVAMVADPDGDGIDAASVGLHMIKVFRARCEAGIESMTEEVKALGAATRDIPLTRPIGLVIVSVDPAGGYELCATKFASVRCMGGPDALLREVVAPDGIVGPLRSGRGTLAPGASLLLLCAGLGDKEATLEADALVRFLERAHGAGTPLPVDDAVTWARGRTPALAENDVAVVALARQA